MSEIKITISGVTHTFNSDAENSIKEMPWDDRKKLIALLESIQQAEYIKPVKSNIRAALTKPHKRDEKNEQTQQAKLIRERLKKTKPSATVDQSKASHTQLDLHVKASKNDVSDLMNRLILEEKQHHKPIPEKAAVIKILLVIFVVIILLAMLF